MKKNSIVAVALTVYMIIYGASVAEAGIPVEDTWLLNYKGLDWYVQAGSLSRRDVGNMTSGCYTYFAYMLTSSGSEGWLGFARLPDGDTCLLTHEGAEIPNANKELIEQLYDAIHSRFNSYF